MTYVLSAVSNFDLKLFILQFENNIKFLGTLKEPEAGVIIKLEDGLQLNAVPLPSTGALRLKLTNKCSF